MRITRHQMLAQWRERGCAKREHTEDSESMSAMSERKKGVSETGAATANAKNVTAAIFIVQAL